jgi:hypothetical protein
MADALTVDEVALDPYKALDWYDCAEQLRADAEKAISEQEAVWAEEDEAWNAAQEAAYQDGLVSRLADEIAHAYCMLANEPRVFLAARDAADHFLGSCVIYDGPDGPYCSNEDYEKAGKAARDAARPVAYRLLRLRLARRGRLPGFWPVTWAFRTPNARARAPRTRRVASSVGSRGDPSSDDDSPGSGVDRLKVAVVRLAQSRRAA